jgi:transcriptional regulator with XRE-family HTH domain
MKNQKSEPELINLSELARRAGVGPAAVSQFLRKRMAKGSPVPTVPGAHRREKLVDAGHPLVLAFIQNQGGGRGGDRPSSPAALEKLKAQVDKAELSADVLRAWCVDKNTALKHLDKLLETERRELSAMIGRILRRLDREFGPLGDKQTAEAQWILEQPCSDALEMSRREVEAFRNDTKPRTQDTKPTAPAPKGRRGKNGKNNPFSKP